MNPRRPVLLYHGGKWRMAPWIISHFPPHRVYVEPYGGGGSVLMRKPRTYAEIYNDLDTEVVNVFRILRDPTTALELERLIRLTPFSREDFETAYTPADDLIEQARRTILKSFAGHGSDSIHRGKASDLGMFTRVTTWKANTGFRGSSNRSGTTPAHDWSHYPIQIEAFCRRLQGVVIENRPALKVINQYDKPDALIYVDPPYVQSSRRRSDHGYRHELDNDAHNELLETLKQVRGMVVISAYPSELYSDVLAGWESATCRMRTGSKTGAKGTEVLWFSPNVPVRQHELF